MTDLNSLGVRFHGQLVHAQEKSKAREADATQAEKVHVVGAGGTLTAVYEQLRNAAEYTEEHLLLQRAIRRFYRRLFLSRDRRTISRSGEELIVELTLAGYLKNDTVPVSVSRQITEVAQEYLDALSGFGKSGKKLESWTIDVAAVKIEQLLNDHLHQQAFVQFAHDHFIKTINVDTLFGGPRPDFEVALFAAIHRAMLHSDTATIRAMLLERYNLTPKGNLELYQSTNAKIDELLDGEEVEKLYRYVNRQGAAFRILWRMIEDQPNLHEVIGSRDKFLRTFEAQVTQEYDRIHGRINRGIVKSVVFLIITKFIVGIAIEVPYDYLVHGSIIWLPLVVNLLFPPVYMLLLRATLMIPGDANTRAMVDRIDQYLYAANDNHAVARTTRGYGVAYNIAYALFFLVVFGGVSWLLFSIGFSLLHLFIFFVFLSTASFLGFRLSGMIRELEVVDSNQNGVIVIRDFLYMPFVVVGRWISEKYAKVNVVASLLDMVIELPLKTVLRLIRQWSAFISSKKDEL